MPIIWLITLLYDRRRARREAYRLEARNHPEGRDLDDSFPGQIQHTTRRTNKEKQMQIPRVESLAPAPQSGGRSSDDSRTNLRPRHPQVSPSKANSRLD